MLRWGGWWKRSLEKKGKSNFFISVIYTNPAYPPFYIFITVIVITIIIMTLIIFFFRSFLTGYFFLRYLTPIIMTPHAFLPNMKTLGLNLSFDISL